MPHRRTDPSAPLPCRAGKPLSARRSARVRRWLLPVALTAYVGLLCAYGYVDRQQGAAAPTPGWNPSEPAWLVSWVERLVLKALMEIVRFLPIGLLAVLAMGRSAEARMGSDLFFLFPQSNVAAAATGKRKNRSDPSHLLRSCAQAVLALGIALGLSVVACGFDVGRWPASWRLALPAIGCLIGAWIGVAWRRGRRARLWLIPELLVPLLLLAGAAFWFWRQAIEDRPLGFAPTQVTAADKRHLVDLVRDDRGRRSRQPGDVKRLRLSAGDVNLLIAWWLRLDRPGRKARVWLAEGMTTAQATLAASTPGGDHGYVNLSGAALLVVDRGHLLLDIQQLRVGRVGMPGWVLGIVSPLITAAIEEDPNMKELLACTNSVRVETDGLIVAGDTGVFRNRVLPLLAAKRAITPAVTAATQVQIRHLLSSGDQPRRDWDARFLALLQTAFDKAGKRSRAGNPIVENQAAILALAILTGDRRIEQLVGPVSDREVPPRTRRRMGWVRLRGRTDWAKHFVISAALTLLLDSAAIDTLGVFKETLDSTEGGSGFSFADLMADRAGRRFALAATRDEQSARTMQARMTGQVRVDDFFPPAADLPEGISADELKSRYGGVGGAAYRKIEREIDRRLEACPAL